MTGVFGTVTVSCGYPRLSSGSYQALILLDFLIFWTCLFNSFPLPGEETEKKWLELMYTEVMLLGLCLMLKNNNCDDSWVIFFLNSLNSVFFFSASLFSSVIWNKVVSCYLGPVTFYSSSIAILRCFGEETN